MTNALGHSLHCRYFAGFVSLLCSAPLGSVSAQEFSRYESLWRRATVYYDDQNPILQEFKWRGRYHGQYHDLDAKQGSASGWEDRRSRFGFDAALWDRQLEIRMDFQSNDGFEDFYDGLVDAYLRWVPSDAWSVTIGKQQPRIAYHEWMTTVNELPLFERSLVFNQLQVNRATGLVIEGSQDGFSWQRVCTRMPRHPIREAVGAGAMANGASLMGAYPSEQDLAMSGKRRLRLIELVGA